MPAPFSESFRATLKRAYEDGKDDKTIRKEFNVSGGKVKKMRESYNTCGEVWVPTKNKTGGGRPRKITTYQEDELKKFLDNNPDAFIRDMSYFLNSRFDIDVDDTTVWRTIARRGWRIQTPKKPRERNVQGFWLPPTENDGELIPAEWRETTDRSKKLALSKQKPEPKAKMTGNDKMVERTRAFVQQHMVAPRFDASHDAGHVMRVEKMALHLLKIEQEKQPETLYDSIVLSMAALMHDVEDHKYSPARPEPQQSFVNGNQTPQSSQQSSRQLEISFTPQQTPTRQSDPPAFPWPAQVPPPSSTPAQAPSQPPAQPTQLASDSPNETPSGTPVTASSPQPTPGTQSQPTPLTPQQFALSDHLRTVKCPPHMIHILIHLIPCISYSYGLANPNLVADMHSRHPELKILQDADRLDALGAIGISRAFCFSGMNRRGMTDTFSHFHTKLEKLADEMHTEEAKRIAQFRAEKLKGFKEAWDEEAAGWDYAPPTSNRMPGLLHGQRPSQQLVDEHGHIYVAAGSAPDVSTGNGEPVQQPQQPPQQQGEQTTTQNRNQYGRAPLPPNVDPNLHGPVTGSSHIQAPGQEAVMNGSRSGIETDPGRQLMEEMYGMR